MGLTWSSTWKIPKVTRQLMFKNLQLHEKRHFCDFYFCYQGVRVMKILGGIENLQRNVQIAKENVHQITLILSVESLKSLSLLTL